MKHAGLFALCLWTSGCAQLLDGDHDYVLGGTGGAGGRAASGGATTGTTTGPLGGGGGSTVTSTSTACSLGETYCGADCADLSSDPFNCGYCGHDCNDSPCNDGLCDPIELASDLCYPDSIDVDQTHVFFTTETNVNECPGSVGTVQRVAKVPDSLPETISKNLGVPWSLRLFQGHAYWIDRLKNVLQRAYKNGLGPQTLADPLPFVDRIEVNDFGVYVAQSWSDVSGAGPGSIGRIPLSGGPMTWIAQNLSRPHYLALNVDTVFFGGSSPPDGATPEDGYIASVPLGGGPVTVLADQQLLPQGIVVDADAVYWANDKEKVLRKRVFQSGALVTLATEQENVHVLAQDESFIYWTTLSGGVIARVAKSGGPVQILASGRQRPFGIAVYGKRVYWSESMPNGRIMSVPM